MSRERIHRFTHKSGQFNTNNVLDRLICGVCSTIMIIATQTECGCRFCWECINTFLCDGGTKNCPKCLDSEINRHWLMKDKAMEKEISMLEVICGNGDCGQVLPFKELDNHFSVCDFRQEKCDKCEMVYAHNIGDEHRINQCTKSVVVCKYCAIQLTKEELTNKHLNHESNIEDICEKWNGTCPYQCDDDKPINVKCHLEICPNKPTDCPLKQLGCPETGSRDSIKIHWDNDFGLHQLMMIDGIHQLRQENMELRRSFKDNEMNMSGTIQDLMTLHDNSSDQLTKLTNQIKEIENGTQLLFAELNEYKQNTIQPMRDIVIGSDHVIWIIRNIRMKIEEARSGINCQITTDTFYLVRPGYNMSLKIYPNGDGRAKDNYLSLYFVINKGEYDNEIQWPFQMKVTLGLLSSNGCTDDINVHMKPDVNQACYGKPMNNNNCGAGQPQFLKLTEILEKNCYLHDGALKIKMMIKH